MHTTTKLVFEQRVRMSEKDTASDQQLSDELNSTKI